MRRFAALAAAALALAGCGAPPDAPKVDRACGRPGDGADVVVQVPPERGGRSVAFSPDGALVAVASDTRMVHLVDAATLEVRARWLSRVVVHAVAFHPRLPLLYVAGTRGEVVAFDLLTHRERPASVPAATSLVDLALAADGSGGVVVDGERVRSFDADLRVIATRRVVSLGARVTGDGALAFLPTPGNDTGLVWSRDGRDVLGLGTAVAALHPDGATLASASAAGDVELLRLAVSGGRAATPVEGHAGHEEVIATYASRDRVLALAWTRDGARLVGATRSGLRIWARACVGRCEAAAEVARDPALGFALDPAGERAAIVGKDAIFVHDLATGKGREIASPTRVFDLVWSADGKRVAATTGAGALALVVFDVAAGTARALESGQASPSLLAWSPDGATLVAQAWRAGRARTQAFDAAAGTLRYEIDEPEADRATSLAFTADGKALVRANVGTYATWDALEGKRLTADTPFVDVDVFLPRPRHAEALLFAGNLPRLVDLATARRLETLPALAYRGVTAAFSADGMKLAIATRYDVGVYTAPPGGGDGRAPWSKTVLAAGGVSALAWTPRGDALFAGGSDGIFVWGATSGKRLDVDVGARPDDVGGGARRTPTPWSLGLSADGKLLAASTPDHEVAIYDVATLTAVARAPAHGPAPFAWHPRARVLAVGVGGLQIVRLDDGARVELATAPSGRGRRSLAIGGGLLGGDARTGVGIVGDVGARPTPSTEDRARAALLDELARGCPFARAAGGEVFTPEP